MDMVLVSDQRKNLNAGTWVSDKKNKAKVLKEAQRIKESH